MKHFFLLLVFLNVVCFFLGLMANEGQTVAPQQVPLYAESTLEKLTLVSKDGISEELQNMCYFVGGYADKRDANKLAAALSYVVIRAWVLYYEIFEGFWVVLPSNGDWAQSLAKVEKLKSKGIVDLWLVPNGENKGAVSLGLFKTTSGSEKRLKKLKSMGFSAQIIHRNRPRYSVKVEINGGTELIQGYLDRSKAGSGNDIQKTSC